MTPYLQFHIQTSSISEPCLLIEMMTKTERTFGLLMTFDDFLWFCSIVVISFNKVCNKVWIVSSSFLLLFAIYHYRKMLNIILALLSIYTALPILPFILPHLRSSQDPSTRKLPSSAASSAYSWLPDKHPLIAIVWRTYTPLTLRRYDGTSSSSDKKSGDAGDVGDKNGDGRILFAVNRKVYDVTMGKDFYGAGIVFFPFLFSLSD